MALRLTCAPHHCDLNGPTPEPSGLGAVGNIDIHASPSYQKARVEHPVSSVIRRSPTDTNYGSERQHGGIGSHNPLGNGHAGCREAVGAVRRRCEEYRRRRWRRRSNPVTAR
jgi:hypothetical protein